MAKSQSPVTSTTPSDDVKSQFPNPSANCSAPKDPVNFVRSQQPCGAGTSGTVFQAVDSNGNLVAVKIGEQDSILHDYSVGQKLKHPHLVRMLSYGELGMDPNEAFLVMELGQHSLHDHLDRYGKMEEPVVSKFVAQILDGVAYIHASGGHHGDLKPRNIIVVLDRGETKVKLGDFGSASLPDEPGNSAPTLAYASPEFHRTGKTSASDDVWALGCVILHLRTGDVPLAGQAENVSLAYLVGTNRLRPAIPKWLSDLEKDFINQCFRPEELRPTAAVLLKHPYITGAVMDKSISAAEPQSTTVDNTAALLQQIAQLNMMLDKATAENSALQNCCMNLTQKNQELSVALSHFEEPPEAKPQQLDNEQLEQLSRQAIPAARSVGDPVPTANVNPAAITLAKTLEDSEVEEVGWDISWQVKVCPNQNPNRTSGGVGRTRGLQVGTASAAEDIA